MATRHFWLNVLHAHLQIPRMEVKVLTEIRKSLYSNQTRSFFSTNREKCLAFQRICETASASKHISSYVQIQTSSSPLGQQWWSGPRWVRVIACCLMTLSHNWIQWWFSLVKLLGIHLRVISQRVPKPLFCIVSLKIKLYKYCHLSQGLTS